MEAVRRSICGIYRYRDLTNVRKQEKRKKERKKKVGWLNVFCDLPIAMFSDCISVCVSHACIHVDTQTQIYSSTTCIAWLTAFGLTLLLLAAPAYSYSSIIARYRETHLEAFACRERATISFYLSPLLPLM